jgi:hypothetical protein
MPFLGKPRIELKYHRYDVPTIYLFSSYSTMETDIPECYKRLEYVRILYDKSYAPQYNSNPGIYTGHIHIQYTYIVGRRV